MIFNWYYIFNSTEFLATGLVSRTYNLTFVGIGIKEVLVINGQNLGIVYEGIFLPLNLNNVSPFTIDDHAIYRDEFNNVFLGIKVV